MSVRRLSRRCGSGPDEPEWPDELGPHAAVLAPRGRRAAGRCGSVHRRLGEPAGGLPTARCHPPRPGRGAAGLDVQPAPWRRWSAPRSATGGSPEGWPAGTRGIPYPTTATGHGAAGWPRIVIAPVPGGNVLGRAAHGAHAPAPAPPVRRRAAPPARGPFTLVLRAVDQDMRRTLLAVLHSRVVRVLTFPLLAWFLFAAVNWGWHFSDLYDYALEVRGSTSSSTPPCSVSRSCSGSRSSAPTGPVALPTPSGCSTCSSPCPRTRSSASRS